MFTTVLSMSMFAMPLQVGATASAGDLIKMDGLSSVYYLAADGKRYVFPNEQTYFSWYSDFSGVVTIPQSELESYSLGANVTIRPGTKLVKITTDPKVYAVEADGTLKWVPDEDTATTLYGSAWASLVIDVPDAFFTNYTVSADQVSATAYPEGTLISYADSTDVYLVSGGLKRKVATEAAFTANRYSWDNVITAPDTIVYEDGDEIAGAESVLIDTSSGAGGTAGAGTGLTVALAGDTPAAGSIIADSTANEYPQALIAFTKVDFTAAADGDVKVTTLRLTRTGIASDSDIGNLYLYDGDTRLAEYSSFSIKVVTFSNSAGLFTVPAGTTKTITLKGDLARGNPSVVAGKTIGFEVTAATDITTDGAAVSGSFPQSGSLMSTAAVTDLGHLYFAGAAGSNGSIPSTVKADEANKDLWNVNVTADSQDMEIRYLKFTMVGTIATTDIQNIRLELAGVQVGEAQDIAADNTVIYDLSASPITITSGQVKQLALRGDMHGGSGRVFKFTIQKTSDVVLYDANYGITMTPNVNDTTTAFGVVQASTGNGTTVSAGTITLGVATDSPTGNVPDAATSVTFAKFSFYAAGEAVKVESLSVTALGTGTDEDMTNVKLLLEGTQIGATDSSLTADGSATADFTFGNTFVVPAGSTKYLTVVANTSGANIDSTDTITFSLSAGSSNAVGQTTMTTLSTTAQAGRTLTIASGVATVVENTAFADRDSTTPTGTVSAADVQVASFIITAGSGEAIDVTQIVLQDADATSQMGDNFQNLKIKHSGTQVGSTVASLDSSGSAATYTFTPSSAIRIEAGQQYVVDVYADIKSSVQDSATDLSSAINYYSLTATGVTTGSSASDANAIGLQNAYIAAQGNLTITLDTDSAIAQQLVLGETDVEIAKFKFAADAAEDISISKLVLNDLINTGTGTIMNLKLYDGDTQIGQTVNFTTAYASTTYASLDGLSLTIPRNSNKIITVKADVATFDAVAANSPSASTHEVSFYPTYDGTNEPVTAVGASSGASITSGYLDISGATDAQVRGNQMTAYKTKITIAWAGDTPSGASVGGNDYTVAKINVTNSSNSGVYSATIQTMNFAISHTGISLTADRELKIYKDSITTGNLLETTSWIGSGTENFGDTAITDAGLTDVEISSGGTKLFIITMDTQDAGSTDSLSVNVAADDVTWGDSTTTGITSVNSLPLSPKSLTY